ncbi:ABC transporter ATP-binding protein [Pleomorphochaeta sp. DL1XJH-081]|jgi:sodium transport system ATP-binding protein|uniref:ABC transporter ATP-binding protein n=1 Tax=Pleomorphochaeta sp. DL1XJH-081 TaxID=3409690 RepID=UPI003BB572A0
MIVIDGLHKSYKIRSGKKHVLKGITCTARDGEIYGLLGPNGAGKTTTLRTIATLLKPDSGTVRVDGHDVVTEGRVVRDRIGFLTGEMKLAGQLSCRELLRYFGRLNHMSAATIAKRTEELAADFDMINYLDMPIAKLSSGMTQKVGLAVSIVHEPRNIIFDEPTSSLDVLAVKVISDFLRSAKRNGKCVVLSTHVLADAQRLCDRVGIIYDGELLCEGTVDDLLSTHKVPDIETLFFSLVNKQMEQV